MDNIKTLATEWWRSKSSRGKTSLINKYGKGKEYKQGTYISVQDILEMYEAEHTSIRDGVEEFKEELNKAMMAACNPPSPILNSVKYYEDQIEKWTKSADKLRGEIKELETKSTWSKEEVKRLMIDSFYKGAMAEAFSLPIDFDADKWIEEKINKTINNK